MTMRKKAPPGYFTVQEFAEIVGATEQQILQALHGGKLPYQKVGTRRYVAADASFEPSGSPRGHYKRSLGDSVRVPLSLPPALAHDVDMLAVRHQYLNRTDLVRELVRTGVTKMLAAS